MRTNAINAVNFGAQLKISCSKDLITSAQIDALTKQAEGIGRHTDKVSVKVTKLPSYSDKEIYNASNFFEVGGEKFQTSSDVFYEVAGVRQNSKSPYNYIQKLLSKLSEIV